MTGTKHKSHTNSRNWTNTSATSQKGLILSTSLYLAIETSVSKPAEEERSAAQSDFLSHLERPEVHWRVWTVHVHLIVKHIFILQNFVQKTQHLLLILLHADRRSLSLLSLRFARCLPCFQVLTSRLWHIGAFAGNLLLLSTEGFFLSFCLSLWNGNVSSLSHKHRNSHLLPLSRIHTHFNLEWPASALTHTHTTELASLPLDCGSVFLVCVNSGCPGLKDCPPFSFLALTGLFLSFLLSLVVPVEFLSNLNLNEFNSRFNHWDNGSQAVFTQ